MGGIGSGRKKKPGRLLRDAIQEINIEQIIHNLQEWSRGKEVICPHCNEPTGAWTADTVALQSAIELLNRRLGKVPQSVQLDITETLQLSADDIDKLVERFKIAQRALLPLGEVIEGEVREIQCTDRVES
ncbi:MAG: hypothetical protein MUP81_02655 [Dehalococcoidia bacterium]|nr:hypothetical protein [Dehalococcoidia bacterium]